MTKLSEIRDKFGEHQNLSNLQQQTLGSAKNRKNNSTKLSQLRELVNECES